MSDNGRTRIKGVLGVAVAAALAAGGLGLAGCSSGPGPHAGGGSDGSAGSAAVSPSGKDWKDMKAGSVINETISEKDVNDYVERYRKYAGYTDDDAWAKYLNDSGLTIEDLRKNVITSLAQRIVVRKEADNLGISVSDDDVDDEIKRIKKDYGYEDEKDWKDYLKQQGMDEATYREETRYGLLEDKLVDHEVEFKKADADQLRSYGSTLGTYFAGKRTYDILCEDEARAQKVAADLGDDAVSEEDLGKKAKGYLDDGTAKKAGDRGWAPAATDLSSEYTQAIADVEVGKHSDAFKDGDGWHVVVVTEEYKTLDNGQLDVANMPKPILDMLQTYADQQLNSEAESEYLQGLIAKHFVSTTDMPDGLPYWVDLDAAKKAEEANAEDTNSDAVLNPDGSTTVTNDDGTTTTISTDSGGTGDAGAAAEAPADATGNAE